MEGSRRRRKPPLEVTRGFASSRLERQILVRVYELVVPVVRRSLHTEPPRAAEGNAEDREVLTRLTKGA
jgi:hypothetical protein